MVRSCDQVIFVTDEAKQFQYAEQAERIVSILAHVFTITCKKSIAFNACTADVFKMLQNCWRVRLWGTTTLSYSASQKWKSGVYTGWSKKRTP